MSARLVVTLLLAGCVGPASTECDDGRFCPPHMVCGGAVCLAEAGSCGHFSGRTPCLDSFGTGHCTNGACTPGVGITGRVIRLPDGAGVDQVEVKVIGHPELVTALTASNGRFIMGGIAERSELVLGFARPNFIPGLSRVIAIGDDDEALDNDPDEGSYLLVPAGYLGEAASALDTSPDPALGAVSGVVGDLTEMGGLGGATVAVVPPCEAGPLYLSGDGEFDATATTTGADNAGFAFINCAPGPHEVVVSHPTLPRCGIAGQAGPEPARAPVAAGTLTYVGRIPCVE